MNCECIDGEYTCETHLTEDAKTWARILGLTPAPYDASSAYSEGDYRGRYTYSWDAA